MRRFPDARTLLAVVVVVTSLAIALKDPLWLGGVLVVTLGVLLAFRVSPLRLLRRLRRYRWLFLILILAQSLTNSTGQIYLQWQGFVLLSSGGLLAALAAMLRIIIILAAALLLSLRNYQEVVTALAQLKVPYELAYMVLLGVRFIPVFMEEFRQAMNTIQLRGIELEKVPLRGKLRIYSYILMPAVAGAVIRARRIAIAMDARAFRAKERRTWLDWPRLGRGDWLLMAATAVAGVVCWTIYKGWI